MTRKTWQHGSDMASLFRELRSLIQPATFRAYRRQRRDGRPRCSTHGLGSVPVVHF